MEISTRFWRAMTRPIRRRILRDAIFDIKRGRLPRATFISFARALQNHWAATAPNMPPESLVIHLQNDQHSPYLCQGKPDLHYVGRCSRIMSGTDLIDFNIRYEEMGIRRKDTGPISYSSLARVLRHLEDKPADYAKGTMRGLKPIAWITMTTEIDAARRSANGEPQLAASLWDRLGLSQEFAGQVLAEVIYPPGTFVQRTCHPPTSLDGAPRLEYCSNIGPGGWGETRCHSPESQGIPEAVHRELDFTPQFRIRRVGRVPPNGHTP